MENRPYTTRLYASLSEPRPIMEMDWRLCCASGLFLVLGVCLIPFSGALCYAPSLACFLLCVGIARFGKRLWSHNPYFIDEYLSHLATPLVMGADEKVIR